MRSGGGKERELRQGGEEQTGIGRRRVKWSAGGRRKRGTAIARLVERTDLKLRVEKRSGDEQPIPIGYTGLKSMFYVPMVEGQSAGGGRVNVDFIRIVCWISNLELGVHRICRHPKVGS